MPATCPAVSDLPNIGALPERRKAKNLARSSAGAVLGSAFFAVAACSALIVSGVSSPVAARPLPRWKIAQAARLIFPQSLSSPLPEGPPLPRS